MRGPLSSSSVMEHFFFSVSNCPDLIATPMAHGSLLLGGQSGCIPYKSSVWHEGSAKYYPNLAGRVNLWIPLGTMGYQRKLMQPPIPKLALVDRPGREAILTQVDPCMDDVETKDINLRGYSRCWERQ